MSWFDSVVNGAGDLFGSVLDGVESGFDAVGSLVDSLGDVAGSISGAGGKVEDAIQAGDGIKDKVDNVNKPKTNIVPWLVGAVVLIVGAALIMKKKGA